MSTLYFRTVGGNHIGLGHVYRSLGVAKTLRIHHGVKPVFIVNRDERVASLIEREGFEVATFGDSSIQRSAIESLQGYGTGVDGIVCYFDMKFDVSDEIKLWRSLGARVLLMDNTTPAHSFADTTVLPVPYVHDLMKDRTEGGPRVVGGKEWIPVSPVFLEMRDRLPSFSERKCILVSMGGADPNKLTLRIMKSLAAFNELEVRIVLGLAAQFKQQVYELNVSYGNKFEIIENSSNMAALMLETGLAVTALGTTIYELATLGVPTLILSNYLEDKRDEQELQRLGWVIPLGYHLNVDEQTIAKTVRKLWENAGRREEMSAAALAAIDGKGAQRVSKELMDLVNYQKERSKLVGG